MNVLLPFEDGSFTLVLDKTHLFVIKLVKTLILSVFFFFFLRSLLLYKCSCSGIISTFIV